jgi:hypothetical protein
MNEEKLLKSNGPWHSQPHFFFEARSFIMPSKRLGEPVGSFAGRAPAQQDNTSKRWPGGLFVLIRCALQQPALNHPSHVADIGFRPNSDTSDTPEPVICRAGESERPKESPS